MAKRNQPPNNAFCWRQQLLMAFLLGAVVCLTVWRSYRFVYTAEANCVVQAKRLTLKIDPNVDPWWKLAALPNIGMVKAKRVVAFRSTLDRCPAFASAQDLARVQGIGPETIAKIQGLLVFTSR